MIPVLPQVMYVCDVCVPHSVILDKIIWAYNYVDLTEKFDVMAHIFLADLPPFKVSQSQMVRINHWTILHHFLDNYRFWSKSQIFPTCVFNTSTKVF